MQFVSATKQCKSLLMDKHAGSVNTEKKLGIVFEKLNKFDTLYVYIAYNYIILAHSYRRETIKIDSE